MFTALAKLIGFGSCPYTWLVSPSPSGMCVENLTIFAIELFVIILIIIQWCTDICHQTTIYFIGGLKYKTLKGPDAGSSWKLQDRSSASGHCLRSPFAIELTKSNCATSSNIAPNGLNLAHMTLPFWPQSIPFPIQNELFGRCAIWVPFEHNRCSAQFRGHLDDVPREGLTARIIVLQNLPLRMTWTQFKAWTQLFKPCYRSQFETYWIKLYNIITIIWDKLFRLVEH